MSIIDDLCVIGSLVFMPIYSWVRINVTCQNSHSKNVTWNVYFDWSIKTVHTDRERRAINNDKIIDHP